MLNFSFHIPSKFQETIMIWQPVFRAFGQDNDCNLCQISRLMTLDIILWIIQCKYWFKALSFLYSKNTFFFYFCPPRENHIPRSFTWSPMAAWGTKRRSLSVTNSKWWNPGREQASKKQSQKGKNTIGSAAIFTPIQPINFVSHWAKHFKLHDISDFFKKSLQNTDVTCEASAAKFSVEIVTRYFFCSFFWDFSLYRQTPNRLHIRLGKISFLEFASV